MHMDECTYFLLAGLSITEPATDISLTADV